MSLSSSQKGPPIFLNNDHPLFLLIFNLCGSILLKFVSQFIELKTSDNSLSSSFKFLNDSDGCLKISVEGDSVMCIFDFLTDSVLSDDFLDREVSSISLVMNKSRERYFEGFGCKFHVHEYLINVNVIGLDNVGMC
jgi:hypothetical protein